MRSSCPLAGAFEPKSLVHQEPLPIEREEDHKAFRKGWDNMGDKSALSPISRLAINRIRINAPMISTT